MLDEKNRQYLLNLMGIYYWTQRNKLSMNEDNNMVGKNISPQLNLHWKILKKKVVSCQQCDLYKERNQTVFGTGYHHAQFMIIGEAPGKTEDFLGKPFVGKAGQLLNQMLLAAGLCREEIYITNILKCRPPNNRNPLSNEAKSCLTWLNQQIKLIEPRIILLVGKVSSTYLLNKKDSIGQLRGSLHTYYCDNQYTIPTLVTYHPAYLLRRPEEKAKAWQDLQLVITMLNTKHA